MRSAREPARRRHPPLMANDTRRPPGETLGRSVARRLHALPVTHPTHLSTLPDEPTVRALGVSKPESMARLGL
jgi:hypothetical protein